ncbi:hypothetical protein [Vibrio sp. 10N.222.55.B11]|uniref:hypothetical protein n=1 Tax=Vibrio sp. 10N.222.55.B11 TaxID=3229648 RepID=UPI002A6D60E4|nr:membrane hypothetical protein [Vibrio crassostreae]CAK2511265.1 membrane hypothetical protein [Vibrio crassostreae]CAK2515222.1 membrane hypothetical protein [Vibrio crassostreae]CAK2897941.1 membrane hypothetical protein [Vibrio crassostreae]CAK2915091.1 membrane hypothetical protein [Vibrio crassostreae]
MYDTKVFALAFLSNTHTINKALSYKEEFMERFIFRDVTVLITFCTGLLYVMGKSYYSGYLGYWGLSLSYLPLTTPEFLELGFSPFALIGVLTLNLLLPTVGLITLVCYLVYRLFKRLILRLLPESLNKIGVAREGQDDEDNVTKTKATFTKAPLGYIRDGLLVYVICSFGYGLFGSWIASINYDQIVGKQKTVFQQQNDELVSLISCSGVTTLCAVYSHTDSQTKLINIEGLRDSKVVSKPKTLFERWFKS